MEEWLSEHKNCQVSMKVAKKAEITGATLLQTPDRLFSVKDGNNLENNIENILLLL